MATGIKAEIEIKQWIDKMNALNKKALPRAIAGTLNQQATATHRSARENVKKEFILRNRWILNSIKIRYTRIMPQISRMYSETGSNNEGLKKQESGFIARGKGGRFIPLPTAESRTSKNPKKPIAGRMRMNRLGSLPAKSGKGTIFISSKISKRGPAVFLRRGKRLKMLRDLSKKSYLVKKSEWLEPAVNKWDKQSMINLMFTRQAQQAIAALR